MPNPVISHQTPGLLLKIKFPKWIDGTAICLGACVVDINGPIDLIFSTRFINITHSFLGLFIITIPLTMLLTILFCSHIGPRISKYAKGEGFISKQLKYFGIDDWYMLNRKKYDKRFFIIAFYSSLLGGLTHLLIDLPSHSYIELFYPWVLIRAPDFFWIPIIDIGVISIGNWQSDCILTMSELIWYIEDIITFVLSLYLLRYIKRYNLIKKWYPKS